MKHYFLVAKEVGDLTGIVCSALEMKQLKGLPTLDTLLAPFSWRRRAKLRRTSDFRIENGRIYAVEQGRLHQGPCELHPPVLASPMSIRPRFSPEVLRQVRSNFRRIDDNLRANPTANRLFMKMLTDCARSGRRAAQDERGRRARPLHPGFRPRRVDDAVQHVSSLHGGRASDPHHRLSVRHRARQVRQRSIRCRARSCAPSTAAARSMSPRCCTTSPRAATRTIRSPARASPASSARGLGSTPSETETAAWLVEHHLAMSHVRAEPRPRTIRRRIRDFAALVQSRERLKLLLLLTVADIRAVGPGVWTGWKGQLLRTLYFETEPLLGGGHTTLTRTERMAPRARMTLRERARRLAEARPRALHRPPLPVLLAPHRSRRHRRARQADPRGRGADAGRSRPHLAPTPFAASPRSRCWRPTIRACSRMVAGACTGAGANIVDAQISTTRDGMALDTIHLEREFDHAEDEERRARRSPTPIERLLSGEARLADVVPDQAETEAAALGLHRRAASGDRQHAVRCADRDRDQRARPARPALRRDAARSPTSISTSPRRISRPSARRRSTCSTSPT